MPLRFAYNTNGLAHHRLDDAVALLADCGYEGVALTLDHGHLDPFAPDLAGRAAALRRRLEGLGLGVVVETGARFLLDPTAKHEPTFVSADADARARRLDFLTRAVQAAGELGAEAVSFWAGVPRAGVDRTEAWGWLVQGVTELLGRADALGVTLAFEPEPGMLVETVDDYVRLVGEVGDGLRLALDLGHCLASGDREPHVATVEFADHLGAVAIEDMRRGVHEHLPFGEGDLDLHLTVAVLEEVGWSGLVCVELSRDAHRADVMVPAALAALRAASSVGAAR